LHSGKKKKTSLRPYAAKEKRQKGGTKEFFFFTGGKRNSAEPVTEKEVTASPSKRGREQTGGDQKNLFVKGSEV